MTTQKQILISRCRILALVATTLEDVQTSEATAKGLQVIAEELDLMAVDISRLEPEEEIPSAKSWLRSAVGQLIPLSRS